MGYGSGIGDCSIVKYIKLFDLAFCIHYKDGDTIHGVWNSEYAIVNKQKVMFSKLCDMKPVSSLEIKVRSKETGQVNRYTLSAPTDKAVKYVLLYRGMIGNGLGRVKELKKVEQEINGKKIVNPVKAYIPSAISFVIVALEKTDDIDRSPLEAYKTYPVIAKMTCDAWGEFKRED